MKKMTIEDKLGLNTFHTDEENSHIDVDLEYTDEAEIRKLLTEDESLADLVTAE
jgi:ferredoxin-like protein FixX